MAQKGPKRPEIAVTIQIFEFKTSRWNPNTQPILQTCSKHAYKQLLQSGFWSFGPRKSPIAHIAPKWRIDDFAVFGSVQKASKTLCGHLRWFIGLPLSPIYTSDQIWSWVSWPNRAQKGLKNAKMPPYTLYTAKSQKCHIKRHKNEPQHPPTMLKTVQSSSNVS